MWIDAHQHFWNYNPKRDTWITDEMKVLQRNFLPSDLNPLLDCSHISGCVAVQADQSETETQFLVSLAEANDFIKGVVGWVDLQSNNLTERLAYFSQYKKLKGFRHIVQSEPNDFLLRALFINGVRELKKFDFTYDILIYERQLPATLEFVKNFPDQRLVIDHLAKPNIKSHSFDNWKKHIQLIAEQENIFCKISGMITEADWHNWKYEDFIPYLDVVFNSFGIDRIMYGSDWPVCLVAASYEKQFSILQQYIQNFSQAERNKILGGNAIRFYQL
ncbi:MAG: amidohydrolase family protein [Bacteroidetes bacterium]|nr:amidohydrolase family protein [Bacteroidota bacterium]MBS1541973.1 amidohydrolase family protein [Bacteroidota bacterium]